MPNITFILPDESIKVVDAFEGDLPDPLITEILFCIIDDAWIDKIGTADEVEFSVMESAIEPQPNSRLSCQIKVTDILDGAIIHVPEAEW